MAISRIYVSSSNLVSVSYAPESAVLQVEFRHGGVYNYYGVPWEIYAGLMAAASKGAYHAQHIKWAYTYQRVG